MPHMCLIIRWTARAGGREPEALPSRCHHEPDPQETYGLGQEAPETLPVPTLRAFGDP